MSLENPTDDLPSCVSEICEIGGCKEPWAWESEPNVLLCERHADEHSAKKASDELRRVQESLDEASQYTGVDPTSREKHWEAIGAAKFHLKRASALVTKGKAA